MEDTPTKHRGFHIAHLNAQSAKNKIDILKHHIKQLDFDIFTLSETWFTEQLSDQLLTIDNYDVIRLDRAWKEPTKPTVKKGGGVAAYIKSEISYSTTNLSNHNISCHYIEILWITINLPNQKKESTGNSL